MTTTTATRTDLTDTETAAALRQHLEAHRVGADERWDVETLQVLHALAHA